MESIVMENYLGHLQNRGFSITSDSNFRFFIAKHDSFKEIGINLNHDGIMFQSFYKLDESSLKNRRKLLEYVNDLNQSSNIVCFFYDDEGQRICMTFWFDAVHFDVDRFDLIINLWLQDVEKILKEHPQSQKLLK